MSIQRSDKSQCRSLKDLGTQPPLLPFYSLTPSLATGLGVSGYLTECRQADQLYLHHPQTHILERNFSWAWCWDPGALLTDGRSWT